MRGGIWLETQAPALTGLAWIACWGRPVGGFLWTTTSSVSGLEKYRHCNSLHHIKIWEKSRLRFRRIVMGDIIFPAAYSSCKSIEPALPTFAVKWIVWIRSARFSACSFMTYRWWEVVVTYVASLLLESYKMEWFVRRTKEPKDLWEACIPSASQTFLWFISFFIRTLTVDALWDPVFIFSSLRSGVLG